jgi:hypothetical protein
MSTINHDILFHRTGPAAALEYLRQRVQARDLTAPEALALLSALHKQLASGKIQEAGVYSSYSHLLRTLELDMPEIHAYILSNWLASRRTRSAFQLQGASLITDGLPGQGSIPDAREAAASDIHEFMRSALPQERLDSGPEELEEVEEEDRDESGTQVRAVSAAAESAEQDDEPDDPGADESPKEADDRSNEDELEDAIAREESAEAEEQEPAEQDFQDESISEEAESEREDAEVFEPRESDTDAITALSETPAGSAGVEESEWPAEQELEPADGLEPFDGAENESPPLD